MEYSDIQITSAVLTGLSSTSSNFRSSFKPEHINEILALFHFGTQSFSEIKKYSEIVDMDKKGMDVEIPLFFVEIHCKNVEEARKRV